MSNRHFKQIILTSTKAILNLQLCRVHFLIAVRQETNKYSMPNLRRLNNKITSVFIQKLNET